MPAIPKLGYTFERLEHGATSLRAARSALTGQDETEYEVALRRSARETLGGLEWALKVYLRYVAAAPLAPDDAIRLQDPSLDDLLALHRAYGEPALPEPAAAALDRAVSLLRDTARPDTPLPALDHLTDAIQTVRDVVFRYLPTDGHVLSPAQPPAEAGPRLRWTAGRAAAAPALAGQATALRVPLGLGLLGLAALALGLRALFIGQQSAYMDEATYMLTGKIWLLEGRVYNNVLNWAYGYYVWPLLAGAADLVGGLTAVRLVTAGLSVLTVLATAVSAYRLAPRDGAGPDRWTIGLLAGLAMAVMPTAIGVGRFATYDAPAAAAFMWAVALIFPLPPTGRKRALLGAAALCLIAFLSKYVVAVYFPFICLYLLVSPRRWSTLARNVLCFVAPLSVACAAYFGLLRAELLDLLSFSVGYTDMKSTEPIVQYVYERPEIWALAAVALFGLRRATRTGRLVALGGAAVLLLFQAAARPDHDFWKHSIYLIFCLAPVAALVAAPLVEWLAAGGRSAAEPPHWHPIRLALAGAAFAPLVALSLGGAMHAVTFYPNLTAAIPAIADQSARAHNVLVDDNAFRYYLYPKIQPELVVDPFTFSSYKGETGDAAYRRAISDRHFDAILLDGGIGPIGGALRENYASLIGQYYYLTYSQPAGHGELVEIYLPRDQVAPAGVYAPDGAEVYTFDAGPQGWGDHPQGGEQQPGLNVEASSDQTYDDRPSLKYQTGRDGGLVGLKRTGPVHRITAQVYLVPTDQDPAEIRVGMVAFNRDWQWRDDGFTQTVPTGRWTELTWDLAEPGVYREIDLAFQQGVDRTVYLGRIEIHP